MKKVLFIATCILGILSITSCRSTSSSCGLAKHKNTNQTQQHFQQTTNVISATI